MKPNDKEYMGKKLVFLKLGGSLITDKTKPNTPRLDVITKLAEQIKSALDEDPSLQLIAGNGSGSFAHYAAIANEIKGGIVQDDSNKDPMSIAKVQKAAAQLNRIIVDKLIDVGVPACALHPSSIIIGKNGIIRSFNTEAMIQMLKQGIMPVMYGDIIVDTGQGSMIASTEMLISAAISKLEKKGMITHGVIHNGSVKGVLSSDGKIIPEINQENFVDVKKNVYTTDGYDVTGGMLHKIQESLELAREGIPTQIINGALEKNLLKKALLNKPVAGTVIR